LNCFACGLEITARYHWYPGTCSECNFKKHVLCRRCMKAFKIRDKNVLTKLRKRVGVRSSFRYYIFYRCPNREALVALKLAGMV